MKNRNMKKRVDIMTLILCARCAAQFYNSPEHIIRRANRDEKYKSACTYCGCGQGWTYTVKRKAKSR